MFLVSIRHGVVLRARPLPMTFVAVAHHLRIRPINACGLGCVAGKLFNNVAATCSRGMHAASTGRASRSQLQRSGVSRDTFRYTQKHRQSANSI
jgi:hypothetical protein